MLLLSSCDEEKQRPPDTNVKELLTISIEDFKEIPEDIEGCSCNFSETKEKFEQQQFILVANYDSTAYVSINHQQIKLKLLSSTRLPDTFGDYDHTDIYTSENFKVNVEIRYLDSKGYETWENAGKIVVEDKFGNKLQKEFVGECGC